MNAKPITLTHPDDGEVTISIASPSKQPKDVDPGKWGVHLVVNKKQVFVDFHTLECARRFGHSINTNGDIKLADFYTKVWHWLEREIPGAMTGYEVAMAPIRKFQRKVNCEMVW